MAILSNIAQSIQRYPGWLGRVSGLKAEKMLRGKKTPYLYVLRAGEGELDYYVTFLLRDGSVKHQPFRVKPEGWYYESTGATGPSLKAPFEDVLPLIMHCHKEECTPFVTSINDQQA